MIVTKDMRQLACKRFGVAADATDEEVKTLLGKKLGSGELEAKDLFLPGAEKKERNDLLQTKIFGGGGGGSAPSTQKQVGLHRKTGQPVINPFTRRPAELPSESETLKTGVFLQWLARRSGLPIRAAEPEERRILDQMMQEDTWCGNINNNPESMDGWETAIAPGKVKALLDDSTSGGINVVPEWFDENIVTFPLLTGELFPFVDLVEMPRGRQIETASIGNPTVIWGTAEGTAVGLFNTADLIAQITASVAPVICAIEVGRDMLNDAAATVGSILEQNIGQRMANELDKVVAVGDGTTQPLGIANTSGLIDVPSENGAGGPPTLADYENLMFALPKQYRNAGWNPSFVANDVSYARARTMPVSPIEQSRVFGISDYNAYSLIGYPYRIAESFPNTTIAFACLKKYRMWRRLGFSVEWYREGQTLALKNTWLLVVRGRYAGKVVDPNAVAMMSNAQS